MHIVDFRKFLNLFESIDQLDEDLGDLRNLNAGNLLNVFKQQSQSADAPSFVRSWSGPLLGQNSEMVDLGKIKSWKDLRKASAKNPDLIGAIFYVDGQAFASINYRDPAINMRAPTSTVIFAFDPSKLPELAQEEPPEGLSGWALERWQDDQKRRIPRGTAYEKRDWKDKLQKVTGNAVELRQLEQYLDRVIALFPDNEFTAVGITVDKSGQQKTKDRRERKDVTDPLAGRVKRNT